MNTPRDRKPDIKPTPPTPLTQDGDPQEQLSIRQSFNTNLTWAFKVPRFLLERWERVKEGGVELGTLLIDYSTEPPKIKIRLPDTTIIDIPDENMDDDTGMDGLVQRLKEEEMERRRRLKVGRKQYDTNGISLDYDVTLPPVQSRNTWLFNERVRSWGPVGGVGMAGKRKREEAFPTLVSPIQHEGSIKPVHNDRYLKIVAQRQLESQQTKRPIIQLEDTGLSKGAMNQLASGYTNANSKFGRDAYNTKPHPLSSRQERLPHPDLINRLFSLFSEKPYWGIPALKATLQQPDAWLRECLSEIAIQIMEGTYAHQWKLKVEYEGGRREALTGGKDAGGGGGGGVKDEVFDEGFEDEEEDDEEDDFEEITG